MIPPLASKFVAGETTQSAIDRAETVNGDGLKAILNHLGEHYHDPEPAADDRDEYLELIEMAGSRDDIEATVSVKPSQIGIDIGEDVFRENLKQIVEHGGEHEVFVWVDMEDYTTTDRTLDAFEEMARNYNEDVGLCVQSNLERTRDDLVRLADIPGKVRLVKGAYDEPASVSYKKKERVNERYRGDLEYMFEHFEDGIAVGSHDPEMVEYAIELYEEYETPMEFQMLMGVREDEQVRLANEGYDVYQYIPYGGKWFSYFYRRVRERKENLRFALEALIR